MLKQYNKTRKKLETENNKKNESSQDDANNTDDDDDTDDTDYDAETVMKYKKKQNGNKLKQILLNK